MQQLLGAFESWASEGLNFDEAVAAELRGGGKSYIDAYVAYVQRFVEGDASAFWTANENVMVVEGLRHYHEKLHPVLRMQRIQAFFASEYYANVPHERIGSEFFAMLRQRLSEGAYRDEVKNRNRFGGLFYDVRFIAAYAPYCDAMFVDKLMHQWATDPLIRSTRSLSTRWRPSVPRRSAPRFGR